MKVAHAGIAPAALPGLTDGSWFNPAPPAPVAPPVAANNGPPGNQQNSGSGLDFWLARQIVRTPVKRAVPVEGDALFLKRHCKIFEARGATDEVGRRDYWPGLSALVTASITVTSSFIRQ